MTAVEDAGARSAAVRERQARAPLLEVKDLVKHFPVNKGLFAGPAEYVHAVDRVSFEIDSGETLGLVGESGCGKSTTGRCILRLVEPTAGEVRFAGKNVSELSGGGLRALSRDMQIIFQDPFASLNPRMTVGAIVGEALIIHGLAKSRREFEARIVELLEMVGLNADHMRRYPHEFSGGQRQRIGIARALAVEPKLIVCDEPVSALDVSVQAQILNLLEDMKERYGLTLVFIAHDLAVVRNVSDRVAVMYLGKICEVAAADTLYARPTHPYTNALLSSIPVPDPDVRPSPQDRLLGGEFPSPIDPPSGCRFRTRCPRADERCAVQEPQIREIETGHYVACHYPVEPGSSESASPVGVSVRAGGAPAPNSAA